MAKPLKNDVEVFDNDCTENGGYLYSVEAPLSSQLANARMTELSIKLGEFGGANVLDVGCGDGTYSMKLLELGRASFVTGIDPAKNAVAFAKEKHFSSAAKFQVCSGDDLPFENDSFDKVYFRGVLHHMQNPEKAIQEGFRVAREIVLVEPNGFSPVLKLIEKVSPYHRAHNEKSYTSITLKKWVAQAGGKVLEEKRGGLVPCFCPDWAAKLLKSIEPLVEAVPIASHALSAVYVLRASKK